MLTFRGWDIRVGLKLAPQFTTDRRASRVWQVADDAGFDHVWNFDHFASIRDDTTGDIFEAWTLLGAMAEATKRVRIGCMVTGNTYRHPGVLAKMAVTVDHLSGGRLEFGLGAAWAEGEHTMLGLEFGTVGQRIARLEEACRVVKALLDRGPGELRGRAGTASRPRSRTRSPCRSRTRRSGSAAPASGRRCGSSPSTPTSGTASSSRSPEAARLSGVLDAHCEAVGRDPALVRRSLQLAYSGDVDDLLARSEQYVGAGFTELIVYVSGRKRRG